MYVIIMMYIIMIISSSYSTSSSDDDDDMEIQRLKEAVYEPTLLVSHHKHHD